MNFNRRQFLGFIGGVFAAVTGFNLKGKVEQPPPGRSFKRLARKSNFMQIPPIEGVTRGQLITQSTTGKIRAWRSGDTPIGFVVAPTTNEGFTLVHLNTHSA